MPYAGENEKISIHASTWEATLFGTQVENAITYFNSRLYMRGNEDRQTGGNSLFISIHASTWEATCGCSTDFFPASYFNSRLYMRGNVLRSTRTESENQFQFTPLHERQFAYGGFPTSAIRISIHASTWEATWRTLLAVRTGYFNSRLYMRGNGKGTVLVRALLISIHASTWEATPRAALCTTWT